MLKDAVIITRVIIEDMDLDDLQEALINCRFQVEVSDLLRQCTDRIVGIDSHLAEYPQREGGETWEIFL